MIESYSIVCWRQLFDMEAILPRATRTTAAGGYWDTGAAIGVAPYYRLRFWKIMKFRNRSVDSGDSHRRLAIVRQ
jgi:hypothetical protein